MAVGLGVGRGEGGRACGGIGLEALEARIKIPFELRNMQSAVARFWRAISSPRQGHYVLHPKP